MSTPPGTLVERYGSGHVRTEIMRSPDGRTTWIRSAGGRRTQPFLPPQPSLLTALEAITGKHPGVRYALPRPHGHTLHYPTPGAASTADVLFSPDPQAHARAGSLLEHLGTLLRALHTAPFEAADTALDAPLTWLRLSAWMDSPLPGPPAVLHARLRQGLGTRRWQLLTSWRESLRSGPRVLLHGNPSLGLLVPSESDEAHALLTGEEFGLGSRQQDVGWVLGELHELRSLPVRLPFSADPAGWDRLAARFIEGYGLPPDPSAHRAATLKVLLHLHDFCVFVTWDDAEVLRYIKVIAHLVDEQGED
ncbi:hypothetical protein ACODT3_21795 [Streptomyces sp. 4.24]|uniref:hypothetical protein n=1 Tax=Streptomyces tritrimontium TaxID=3406573 RepID=UPI003BB6B1C9